MYRKLNFGDMTLVKVSPLFNLPPPPVEKNPLIRWWKSILLRIRLRRQRYPVIKHTYPSMISGTIEPHPMAPAENRIYYLNYVYEKEKK